jgi:molybdopterin synthase catalytic subunit
MKREADFWKKESKVLEDEYVKQAEVIKFKDNSEKELTESL